MCLKNSSIVVTLLILLVGLGLLPHASASAVQVNNESLACSGNNVVVSWTTVSTGGQVVLNWGSGPVLVVPVIGPQSYTITGPGTFTVTVTDTFGPVVLGPITCAVNVVVNVVAPPQGFCFQDARVNKNCGATVQVYLTEVEEGWNMLLIGLAEDLGEKHVFIGFEEVQAIAPGETLTIGIVTLQHLEDGTWLLIAPREGGNPYYLHFKLAGRGLAYISDGDLD